MSVTLSASGKLKMWQSSASLEDGKEERSEPLIWNTNRRVLNIYTYLIFSLHCAFILSFSLRSLCVPQTHPGDLWGYLIVEFCSPPSLFATKYRLLSHLWEWFCSLNITISTFSWPTETSSLALMLPPSTPHLDTNTHTPSPLKDLLSECWFGFALPGTWVQANVESEALRDL